jgi:hypothetical protein
MEEVKSVLKDEIVIIRFIPKNDRYNSKHILKGGMHRDGKQVLTPWRLNGRIREYNSDGTVFLSKEELESLGQTLGYPIPYSNEQFWSSPNLQLTLVNGDTKLDLKNPFDYIKLKIAYSYDLKIAKSWAERDDQLTFKWAIIRNNEDVDESLKNINVNKTAYMLYGKYENDKRILSYLYYKLEFKHVDPNIKVKTLQAWFDEILEKKTRLFVKYCEDPLLEEKALVYHAARNGLLIAGGNNILFYGDTKLTDDSEGGEDVAAAFIAKTRNQQIKLELMGKMNS